MFNYRLICRFMIVEICSSLFMLPLVAAPPAGDPLYEIDLLTSSGKEIAYQLGPKAGNNMRWEDM